MKLLIANRGEVAIRVIRAASDLGIATVAVYSKDDEGCLHTGKADEAVRLDGSGPSAYLASDEIIAIAKVTNCEAIHPGYGFLAENADFAQACEEEGIRFVGPQPQTLLLTRDKLRMRQHAESLGIGVVDGSPKSVTVEEAATYLDAQSGSGIVLKPRFGEGGRGIRIVTSSSEVPKIFEASTAEAIAAFGSEELIFEELLSSHRQVEVQIFGEPGGKIHNLGLIDSSLQRSHQKLIDISPCPNLSVELGERIGDAAIDIAESMDYESLGTFEFLVNSQDDSFLFLEVNPRLEVEHPVVEATTGIDLVEMQLLASLGKSAGDFSLDVSNNTKLNGYAIQVRVHAETMNEDGQTLPDIGTFSVYEIPSGPGIRTDGFVYTGYENSPAFDSLIAKVVGHSADTNPEAAVTRTLRALAEFRVEGVHTNIRLLEALLTRAELVNGETHTTFVDDNLFDITHEETLSRRFTEPVGGAPVIESVEGSISGPAVGPEGSVGLASPIQGTIVAVEVSNGDEVRVGQLVAVVEAMKLQHDIKADRSGIVCAVSMGEGDVVREGYPIVFVNESVVEGGTLETDTSVDLDHIRGDLREMLDRRVRALDESHAQEVEDWHRKGRQTPRESVTDLLDNDSFKEFGPLAAGQTAGGVVMGVGSVNAMEFGDEKARVAVVHYDAMNSTGTRQSVGEYKQDRLYELAHRYQMPLVLFSEGMGRLSNYGRKSGRVNMDTTMFAEFAKLSGLVPLVGINTGECFGGNAALLGCCDVIIATKQSSLGMTRPDILHAFGGEAETESGSGIEAQVSNGVVDLLAENDREAAQQARRYLSYFQGSTRTWDSADQRYMRHIIPEDRVRTYEVRDIINTLADTDSVMELRRDFGIGIITAFFRIEGRPLGLVANNPVHLAGAIDSDGADKGTRFLQLCDAFDIPVLTMMDCPGIMVGPDHEREALVRHCARMFNVGANLTTPMFGLVVRKAYGLGVQAMCGASSLVPFFTVAWPTAEFAGMNIDGGVKLSSRRELMAIEDPEERKEAYDRKVSQAYEGARAVNSAGNAYGIDDIIDPADTREWLIRGLKSLPSKTERVGKKRPNIDTW